MEKNPNKRGQGNRGRPRDSGSRGRGQRLMSPAQNLPCQVGAGAIQQSRFQQNQLLVGGLSALTTEDCLVNFIEAMSGGEVEDVMLRDGKALITMSSDITGKLS